MRLEEGVTRSVLGQIHTAAGAFERAAQQLEASLEILEALDSRYEIGQTLVQLARLYRRAGDWAQAVDATPDATPPRPSSRVTASPGPSRRTRAAWWAASRGRVTSPGSRSKRG